MGKNKKSKKSGGGLLLMGALAAGAYWYFTRMTRAEALAILAAAGHQAAALADPRSYQDGYLIAWAKSIQKGQNIFSFEGKQFISATGTHA